MSISTFRYVPETIPDEVRNREEWLNELNRELLKKLQSGGKVYLSNAVIDGRFALRACIVNFRTTLKEIEALPELVACAGRELYATFRQSE